MVIGVLTMELDIPAAQSLKDKRAVLNRIKARTRNKFNVSIAEVEPNNVWNYAILGAVVVSNDQKFCNKVLSQIVNLVEDQFECELADYTTEYINV